MHLKTTIPMSKFYIVIPVSSCESYTTHNRGIRNNNSASPGNEFCFSLNKCGGIESKLLSSVQRQLEQTEENLIFIPRTMRLITQRLPCSTMDHIYTQTAEEVWGTRWDAKASGGHLTKDNLYGPVGRKPRGINHAKGNPSPKPLNLRHPL